MFLFSQADRLNQNTEEDPNVTSEGGSSNPAPNQGYVPTTESDGAIQMQEIPMHELPIEFKKNDDLPPTYEQVTSKIK
jgi:hypothetical protein